MRSFISTDYFLKPGDRPMKVAVAAVILLAGATLARAASGAPENPDGVWVGTTQQNGQQVPFQLEVGGSGDDLHAALINGRQKSPASSANYSDGHLVLHFDYYANTLDATVQDGVLTGTFGRTGRFVPITARLNDDPPAPSPDAPNIAGVWEVSVDGPKGEKAWKLQVRQSGPKVEAVARRGVCRKPLHCGGTVLCRSQAAGGWHAAAAYRCSRRRTAGAYRAQAADRPLPGTGGARGPDAPYAPRQSQSAACFQLP